MKRKIMSGSLCAVILCFLTSGFVFTGEDTDGQRTDIATEVSESGTEDAENSYVLTLKNVRITGGKIIL